VRERGGTEVDESLLRAAAADKWKEAVQAAVSDLKAAQVHARRGGGTWELWVLLGWDGELVGPRNEQAAVLRSMCWAQSTQGASAALKRRVHQCWPPKAHLAGLSPVLLPGSVAYCLI
jgi:hypothetical protein